MWSVLYEVILRGRLLGVKSKEWTLPSILVFSTAMSGRGLSEFVHFVGSHRVVGVGTLWVFQWGLSKGEYLMSRL
jgi:hypothetical protein